MGFLSNFERETALEGSAFSWVLCLIDIRHYDIYLQKIINMIGLPRAYGLVYAILVA